MYKNRIRLTTSKRTPNNQQQFFIRRSDIAFDERVAYVESVCQALVESRFGPGRVDPVIINFSDRPELEPAVFYNLLDDELNGQVSFYALSSLGRAGYQVVEAAYQRAKQMELLDAGPNANSSMTALTPNQGRGSP